MTTRRFQRGDLLRERRPTHRVGADTKRSDLLRRFTSTQHSSILTIMGKAIRVESNSPLIVEVALQFFGRYPRETGAEPDFQWRIVGEADPQRCAASIDCLAFSDRGLRFANLGQRAFLAVDVERREAVGFVDPASVECEPTLSCRSVFDTLFSMCSGALGLTVLAGGCVGKNANCVLIFGPPSSGKTTTSYLAAKQGLEFHSDQAVFLDMHAGELRAWGDLMPAIFRPESVQFLPELRTSTRLFSYPELTVLYLSKEPFRRPGAHPVTPVGSVFLNRLEKSKTSIARIRESELRQRFLNAILYRDDDQFRNRAEKIAFMLARAPGYELSFSDPATAGQLVRALLQ